MRHYAPDTIIFLTLIRRAEDTNFVRILSESLRAFGGDLGHCPVWLFTTNLQNVPDNMPANIQVFHLLTPKSIKHYFFADKVFACAQAEAMVSPEVQSLVWIDPECLVVQPPVLFNLGTVFDAAVRPVHIKNVGLSPEAPVDLFWQKVYEIVGIEDVHLTVETFVDQEPVRAYFNSHAFAINPARRLLSRWLDCFARLVNDQAYQTAACQNIRQQIFLHQAVWSALLAAELDEQRLLILPPDYNYPYNLHLSVPGIKRARSLNELVCVTYEDRSLNPAEVTDIEIREPLRTWLENQFGSSR